VYVYREFVNLTYNWIRTNRRHSLTIWLQQQ